MPPAETYLPTEAYLEVVAAPANLKPDLWTGKIEEHKVMEVLGEAGGIQSASVLDAPARIEREVAA